MECYFGSVALPQDNEINKTAVVAFSIPELGIKFKAPFAGVNDDHSDFASLLALLEFIDGNQKYFSRKAFQIYGSNLSVVNQVNQQQELNVAFSPLMDKAKMYRDKYRFSLEWTPSENNPDYDSLFD
ncbi:MAG: hypothetical protein P1R58_06115 [bacterium]|nr:hypothetical protein [bacterium]